jgi:hypothetical protein
MANEPALHGQSGALYHQSYDIRRAELPAKMQRAVEREGAWGLIQAARAYVVAFVVKGRIRAAELVVARAMLGLDRLHCVEAALIKDNPIQAARYDSLVEDFVRVSRHEIRQMPREF